MFPFYSVTHLMPLKLKRQRCPSRANEVKRLTSGHRKAKFIFQFYMIQTRK